jgi:hypothetical protein
LINGALVTGLLDARGKDVKVVADDAGNNIILTASPAMCLRVEKLIKQLDVPPDDNFGDLQSSPRNTFPGRSRGQSQYSGADPPLNSKPSRVNTPATPDVSPPGYR